MSNCNIIDASTYFILNASGSLTSKAIKTDRTDSKKASCQQRLLFRRYCLNAILITQLVLDWPAAARMLVTGMFIKSGRQTDKRRESNQTMPSHVVWWISTITSSVSRSWNIKIICTVLSVLGEFQTKTIFFCIFVRQEDGGIKLIGLFRKFLTPVRYAKSHFITRMSSYVKLKYLYHCQAAASTVMLSPPKMSLIRSCTNQYLQEIFLTKS